MKKIVLYVFALLVAIGAQAKTWYLEDLKNGKTYTFQNGDEVTGTLNVNATLLIANGATITLRDANISFYNGRWKASESHAGLATEGDATILLEGNNNVEARGTYPPAIYVAKGWTLTINVPSGKPGGKLYAYSKRGAGIGAGYKYYKNILSSHISCGNIVIRGGEVYAESEVAAGIGGGYETSCGTITISGGKVTATGHYGAGIGSGYHIRSNGSDYWSECGKITITGGKIHAKSTYTGAGAGIGCGENGKCAGIEITSGVDSLYVAGGIGKGINNTTYSTLSNGLRLFGSYYAEGITTDPYIYPVPSTPQPEPEPVCEAPTNVRASEITYSSAKITWNANASSTFNVRYKIASGDIEQQVSSNGTTTILDNLQANTTYSVWIYQNCANGGMSEASSPITFKTAQKPTPAATDEVYTVFEDGVLTYYYDSKKSSRSGVKEVYDPASTNNRFTDYCDQVEVAVIDPSMYSANLTSYASMFYGGSGPRGARYPLKNMTHIYGLENLNWYEVNSIANMFTGCKSLTALDLSAFNTFSVTNMKGVFSGCSGLTELNIAMWDFSGVTDIMYMFENCSALETIYCNQNLGAQTSASEVFYGCSSALVGGEGTTWISDRVSNAYARPDGGSSNPGYFTPYTCKEPLNIQASDLTASSAVITWDVADEYQYGWLILYRKASGGMNKFVYTNFGSIHLTDLEPKTTYNVYISGECGSNMQSFDASFSFTTPSAQGIDEILDEKNADQQKFIIDGRLVIKVGDKLYDAQGKELK